MDSGTLIHARFEAQAAARPDALAISSEHGALTYGRLDALSRNYAARIDAAAPDSAVVAILAERGPHVVIAALACARAGRPFVILDRAYPAQRLGALIDICRPSLILAASADAPAELRDAEPPTLAIDLEPSGELAAFTPTAISHDDPAYLLFTSGSTGAPKCVACSHRPLTHFVAWQAATFALTADDRFTMLSGLSHDPVLRDIFTPLSLGASIHIPTQATLTAPGALRDWFGEVRPTVAHMTPPLGHLLTAGRRAKPLRELRYVFWGGDVLRGPLVEALAAIAPACESVNFYGSTETPQAASFYRLPRGTVEARAPIGTGISGFELEIVDEHGQPAADGEAGEIVVRSRYLTLGYVENGRLPPPRTGEARYATGDIARRAGDGQIAIQGRSDDQVKVRGYRVELAEITARALTAPGIAQAITLNVGGADTVRLCCFAEPATRRGLSPETLRAHIAVALPAYMVPDEIVVLDALPLLPNRKIDRQALIQRQSAPAPVAPKAAAASAVEAKLIEEWRGFFRPADVTPTASFASLGGDSLSYVNAYLSIEEVLGSVPDGWATMSLAELAATAKADAMRSPFVQVESAILMRALAISAVVASHFQLVFTGGAATSALIWVSGFIFGGLQLHEVDHRSDAGPIARLLKSLLIPLYLIELPQILAKLATHHAVQLSSLLLYVDLLDFTGMRTDGPGAYNGHEYLMWYIHCIFHIVVIFAALILVARYVFKLRRPAMAAAIGAIVLGLAGRFLLPALFVPRFGSSEIAGMSFFGHSPTTHLATFGLAALCGFLKGRWKLATLALTLAYAAISAPVFGVTDSLSIAAVAGILALAPHLKLPRFATGPVYVIAGASFFIYLLQFKFLALVTHFGGAPLLAFPLAIAGGVGVWRAWNWSSQQIGGLWTALRQRPLGVWRLGEARA